MGSDLMSGEAGAAGPGFADVARLIAGDDAPPWLVKTLTRWRPYVAFDRCIAGLQPTRSKMHWRSS
jgi:hypothetical protein